MAMHCLSAVQESTSLLFTEIVVNATAPSLFHSDFDNFDQFLNTLEGQGSLNSHS